MKNIPSFWLVIILIIIAGINFGIWMKSFSAASAMIVFLIAQKAILSHFAELLVTDLKNPVS